MIRRPPRSTLPYTTLFRSRVAPREERRDARRPGDVRPVHATTSRVPATENHAGSSRATSRSEEHTSELQSRQYLVCRLLLEKKKKTQPVHTLTSTMTRVPT